MSPFHIVLDIGYVTATVVIYFQSKKLRAICDDLQKSLQITRIRNDWLLSENKLLKEQINEYKRKSNI